MSSKSVFIEGNLHAEVKEFANKFDHRIGSVVNKAIMRGMIELKKEKADLRLNSGLSEVEYESNWSKENLF